jgi:hypothetical protein
MTRLDSAMHTIRLYAQSEYGKSDDETCFRIATTLWMGERQTGFHRAKPAEPKNLKLDDVEPVV